MAPSVCDGPLEACATFAPQKDDGSGLAERAEPCCPEDLSITKTKPRARRGHGVLVRQAACGERVRQKRTVIATWVGLMWSATSDALEVSPDSSKAPTPTPTPITPTGMRIAPRVRNVRA